MGAGYVGTVSADLHLPVSSSLKDKRRELRRLVARLRDFWPQAPVDLEERSGARVVKALVPLSEMFGYVGDLRSKTQGRANYSMVFDSYAEVPANVSKEIIAKATGQ